MTVKFTFYSIRDGKFTTLINIKTTLLIHFLWNQKIKSIWWIVIIQKTATITTFSASCSFFCRTDLEGFGKGLEVKQIVIIFVFTIISSHTHCW